MSVVVSSHHLCVATVLVIDYPVFYDDSMRKKDVFTVTCLEEMGR